MNPIIVIAPMLLAALVSMLGRRSMKIGYFSIAMSLASLAIAIFLFIAFLNGGQTSQAFTWFSVAGLQFQIVTSTGILNMILLLLISLVAPFILLYSVGFMRVPSDQGRYYAEICVFTASMMLLSISGSFLTLFIAWEMLGITSYLLIGFYTAKDSAAFGARKSITIIFIGDIAMLAALVLIYSSFSTFSFAQIISYQSANPQSGLLTIPEL